MSSIEIGTLRGMWVEGKLPHRDSEKRLVVERAPEVTWKWAQQNWDEVKERMEKLGIDRNNCQVVVLTDHVDVSAALYRSLQDKSLGMYPAARTVREVYSDGEKDIFVDGEAPAAESVYLVGALVTDADVVRAMRVADHYRWTLNARTITLVCTFLAGGRQDKGVDKLGKYQPKTITPRAMMCGFAGLIDRMIVVEPHSSATQAYAAQAGVALAPLSCWRFLINDVRKRMEVEPDRWVMVRPDQGRNIAAVRAAEYLGLSGVSFSKIRIDGRNVEEMELIEEEQALVAGKMCLVYDDEAATMGTLRKVMDKLQIYKASGLVACLAHCKFTQGWLDGIRHPLLTGVVGTNSRIPIGNIAMTDKIKINSLTPWIRRIIAADIKGVNFWQSESFRDLILQEYSDGLI